MSLSLCVEDKRRLLGVLFVSRRSSPVSRPLVYVMRSQDSCVRRTSVEDDVNLDDEVDQDKIRSVDMEKERCNEKKMNMDSNESDIQLDENDVCVSEQVVSVCAISETHMKNDRIDIVVQIYLEAGSGNSMRDYVAKGVELLLDGMQVM
ncbi:hypothetical protein Tco_0669996 [Tanacetum coccineum]